MELAHLGSSVLRGTLGLRQLTLRFPSIRRRTLVRRRDGRRRSYGRVLGRGGRSARAVSRRGRHGHHVWSGRAVAGSRAKVRVNV